MLHVYFRLHFIHLELHFRKINDDNLPSSILALCDLIMRPPWLNTLSTGELDAGTHRALSARTCNTFIIDFIIITILNNTWISHFHDAFYLLNCLDRLLELLSLVSKKCVNSPNSLPDERSCRQSGTTKTLDRPNGHSGKHLILMYSFSLLGLTRTLDVVKYFSTSTSTSTSIHPASTSTSTSS